MTTALLSAEQELSRQIGDFWSSTTTAAGSSTTLVDSALMAKENDWITDNTWAFLIEEPVGAAAIYDERKVSSLDNATGSTGTLTTLAFDAAPGTGIDYELHRLFSPSEKRRALIAAARGVYPNLFESIIDESIVSHNWLKDGSFEIWTSSSELTHWTKAGSSTLAQTSTAYLFKHGAYSCKISGAADIIKQSVSNWDDLKFLANQTVTFSIQAHCDTASCLRIAIYDGTDTSYSSYHGGDSAWEEESSRLEVTATINDDPTAIEFQILHESAAGTSYVDDARVMGPPNPRIYIGNIGFAQKQPKQVLIERGNYDNTEPWTLIHGIEYDNENGYMYLPNWVEAGYRLRMKGMGYLDFLASGVSSTAWTATINIDSPQLDILVAEAALYLYTQMALPNFTTGDRRDYQEMISFWESKKSKAISKFGMTAPSIIVNRGR